MISRATKMSIGLLLSGGLDSAILLGRLLAEGHHVQPFYVRAHLGWESQELLAARRLLDALTSPQLAELVVLEMPVEDLYGAAHWGLTGRNVPGAASPDEAVYLPGRNAILLIKPALWCQMHGIEELALAVLESNPFGDATPEFFCDLAEALTRATGRPIRFLRPFADMSKRQVMEQGRGLPLDLTFCCLAPIDGLHCGTCNKCIERRSAFEAIGLDDPTVYAGKG